jgi:HSP20 family protein
VQWVAIAPFGSNGGFAGRFDHMPTRNPWMWSEACEVLVRAERQYRQLFQLRRSMTRGPGWEPPVDVLETEREVLVFVALPGVDKDNVQAEIEGGDLVIAGDRVLPPELGSAVIHRLELPRGRFERRVPLPRGRFSGLRRAMRSSCLVIALTKTT